MHTENRFCWTEIYLQENRLIYLTIRRAPVKLHSKGIRPIDLIKISIGQKLVYAVPDPHRTPMVVLCTFLSNPLSFKLNAPIY